MGDELTNLLDIFKKFQKDGRQATLSFATNAGKTKIRLELDLSLSPAESTPPASGGQRRRRRGPAKKAKAKVRAALHQATLASASAADPVARGEQHVPVLKTPEKELSSPPISDLSLTPVLEEGREEPPSSTSTPVAAEEIMATPVATSSICDLPLKCGGGANCYEIGSREHGLPKCGKSFHNENDLVMHAQNNHNYCLEHEHLSVYLSSCGSRIMTYCNDFL